MSNLSFTTLIEYTKEKTRKALYLVLKKKPLSVKSLESLQKKIDEKVDKFSDKIIERLNEISPQEPEKFMKYLMLKAMIKILDKIMNENYMKMSEADKLAAKKIYESEDDYTNEKDGEITNMTKVE